MQLIGRRGATSHLLAVAQVVEDALASRQA
jgi:hypothetical protein